MRPCYSGSIPISHQHLEGFWVKPSRRWGPAGELWRWAENCAISVSSAFAILDSWLQGINAPNSPLCLGSAPLGSYMRKKSLRSSTVTPAQCWHHVGYLGVRRSRIIDPTKCLVKFNTEHDQFLWVRWNPRFGSLALFHWRQSRRTWRIFWPWRCDCAATSLV